MFVLHTRRRLGLFGTVCTPRRLGLFAVYTGQRLKIFVVHILNRLSAEIYICRFNVVTTLLTSKQRCNNVKTTSLHNEVWSVIKRSTALLGFLLEVQELKKSNIQDEIAVLFLWQLRG